MDDLTTKTREELMVELAGLRQAVAELKASAPADRSVDAILSRLAETNYNAIFNAANDAIFILDIETGRIADVNQKACEMYCFPKEELLGMSFHDLSAGEEQYTPAGSAAYLNTAAAGEPQLFEWLGRDKVSRLFWVEINLKRAVIGGKYRLLAVVRDIGERKQTEERLKRINEVFLSFGGDTSENINRLTALAGELLAAECALYNRLESGLLRSCGQWHVPPDFSAADNPEGHICYDVIKNQVDGVVVIRNLQETAYARTDPNVSRYKLETYVGHLVKFGTARIGTLCVVYTYDFAPTEEDRKILGLLASAIGVEEERKSAEAVSQVAQHSIDRAGELIFWIGPTAHIIYANGKACSHLGYTHDELLAMTIHQIAVDFPQDDWQNHWQELKRRGSFSLEMRLRRKDGAVFPVEITVNYVQYGSREYDFAFIRDITERKRQEEMLLKRDYQLEILSRTSQHINAVLETPAIIRTLIAAAMELVGATGGTCGLIRDGKIAFTEYNEEGIFKPISYIFASGDGIPGWVTKTLKPYISNTAASDPQILADFQRQFAIRNLVSIPIINSKGEVLGCFEIHNKEGDVPFDTQDVFMLQGLAASASVALENAKMLDERRRVEEMLEAYQEDLEKIVRERTAALELEIVERKRLEETLRKTLADHEALIRNVPGAVYKFALDAAGQYHFLYVNDKFAEISGIGRETALRDFNALIELVLPEDRGMVFESIRRSAEDLTPWECEFRVRTPQGMKWFYGRSAPSRQPDGMIVWDGIMMDVSARKESEEALRESEVRYRTLYESAHDAIMQLTPEEGFIAGNPAALALYGCRDEDEFRSYGPATLSPEYQPDGSRSADGAAAMMRLALERGSHFFEWTHRRVDGTDFLSAVLLTRMTIGGKTLLQATVRDVTEQKRSAVALQESEAKLKALLGNIPDIAWLKDKESRFISVNEAFGRVCGRRPEELVGKTDLDVWPQTLAARYLADDREVMESGRQKIVDEPIDDKEGRIQWIETIKTPIHNDAGEVIGTAGIARDITERRTAQEELAKYRDHLEQLVKERTAKLEKEIADRRKAEVEKEKLNVEIVKTNKRLKQLVLKDYQTGLYNHRYLDELIESEFYRARRSANPLSIILMDIDYFKSINEVYGRDFGDLVLKEFAAILKRMVRRYDTVIRFGGEEFIIVSPGVGRAKALLLAQRLLDAVGLYNFGDKEHVVKLKLSVAIASYPEDKALKGVDLISLADKVLNKAKDRGGNRVYTSLEVRNGKAPEESEIESNDVRFLREKIEKLTKSGKQSLIESIFAFAKTIELKDHYTGSHAESTMRYSTAIARALNLPPEDIENIRQASVLHDLGKIGVSDRILRKKSKLSKTEFEEIKKHPQIAADIIRPIQFMHDIIPLVLYHHERWDGKGYPAGLKGEEIPIGARIVSVADVYQALTSNRPYRKAFSKREAMQIMKRYSGTHFDPRIVDIFLAILEKEGVK